MRKQEIKKKNISTRRVQRVRSFFLHPIPLRQPFLNNRRKRLHLRSPPTLIVRLYSYISSPLPLQPESKHTLNALNSVWNIPFNSGLGAFHRTIELQNHSRLCNPQSAADIKSVYASPTLAIPPGLTSTIVHNPRNALSFSSLSRISYNA